MREYVSKSAVMAAIYPHFRDDARYVLLAGDMGFAVLDDFFNHHGERAFNAGIAEQATMSIAAGMALTGMLPIVYSQIPFLTMRAFEQIRYDLCEHDRKVKLVGVGVDNYFHQLGRSHCMDNDDLKIMGVFENLLILTPTPETLEADVKAFLDYEGPAYIRCL